MIKEIIVEPFEQELGLWVVGQTALWRRAVCFIAGHSVMAF